MSFLKCSFKSHDLWYHFMHSLRTKLLFLLMLELLPTTFNNKLSHDNIIENTQVSIFKTKESKERWKEMQIAKKKGK